MTAYLRIRFPTLAVYTVSLPLVAFAFCVVWSLFYNFENATFTHCRVSNYLPSISAAIGSFAPQKYVWQVSVAVHSAPRFLVVAMYNSHLSNVLFPELMWEWLTSVIFLLQITEVTSLLGLTFVSSSENFHIHELCFIAFMVSALSNMLLLYLAMKHGIKHKLTFVEKLSLKFKLILGVTNVLCFFTAVYFYFRHNTYCEPFIYTFFALFEYIVVVTNMGYHMTAYWDFFDQVITISSCCSVSVSPKKHPKVVHEDFIIKVA